jgi:hypothetical protein
MRAVRRKWGVEKRKLAPGFLREMRVFHASMKMVEDEKVGLPFLFLTF